MEHQKPYYLHHYIQGRHLPTSALDPPGRPPTEDEIRWHVRGWGDYCVDHWRRLWHRPATDAKGRQRGWRLLRKAVKNGYAGFRMRKNHKEYWMSTRQLKHLLVRP